MTSSPYTWNANPYNNSAANFNAWAGGIAIGLATVGMVQTADTGQINFASNSSYPGAANTATGYQIWKFNDSMAASSPIYFKLEFGSGTSAATNPGLWITIGTGSNGSGTITGIIMARTQFGVADYWNAAFGHLVSGNVNWFLIRLCQSGGTSPSTQIAILVERTHNAGADTNEGVLVLGSVGGSSATEFSRKIPFSGTAPSTYAKWNTTLPPAGTGVLTPNINAFPVRTWNPGETEPFLGVLSYVAGDYAGNSTFSLTTYDGIAHTFITDTNNLKIGYGGNGYPMWRISA